MLRLDIGGWRIYYGDGVHPGCMGLRLRMPWGGVVAGIHKLFAVHSAMEFPDLM